MHFKRVKMLTISVMLLVTFLQSGTAKVWPEWMDISDDVKDLGFLCETDNDLIGTKLGCDCKYPFTTPGKDLYADCSKQTLEAINMPLPPRVNVSRHVRKLIFTNNFFTKLDGNTFGDVEGVYEVDFSKNQIETINNLNFSRMSNLDVSHNLITNLTNDAFINCAKLQDLDLSFNRLTFIETQVFTQLKYLKNLNLASNQIGIAVEYYDEYPFQLANMEWLEQVDLSNNSLRDFPANIMMGTPSVKRLFLKNNLIMFIPTGTFSMFGNLEVLDLSGNLFNTLNPSAFHGLISLHTLQLDSNNELTMIENYAFSGLSNLQELSCQRNHRLTAIDGHAFKADPLAKDSNESRPTTVRLSNNALTFFDAELLSWKDMEYFDLSRNPWNCDCELQWVAELRVNKLSEAAILIDNEFICENPLPLRGTPVATLEPDEMMCYSPVASIFGIIGIVIFCLILIVFCTLVALSFLGLLPESIKKLRIFGNPLKKYSRVDVTPKPNRSRSQGPKADVELSPDLEWDNGDMGRI